jgi:hypothetical protein
MPCGFLYVGLHNLCFCWRNFGLILYSEWVQNAEGLRLVMLVKSETKSVLKTTERSLNDKDEWNRVFPLSTYCYILPPLLICPLLATPKRTSLGKVVMWLSLTTNTILYWSASEWQWAAPDVVERIFFVQIFLNSQCIIIIVDASYSSESIIGSQVMLKNVVTRFQELPRFIAVCEFYLSAYCE